MLELLTLVLVGVFLGIFTGLVPGIHPNFFAVLFLVALPSSSFEGAIVLVAAAVANSFVSFIPSVFLGAPDGGTELSVLPGHKMLLEGRGYEAVRLTVMGGLLIMVLVLITLPLVAVLLPQTYSLIRPYLHWLLAGVLLYALARDRSLWAVVVVALSGMLGILVLENFPNPLFPMLTGLFGVSGLLYTLRTRTTVPLQNLSYERPPNKTYVSGGVAGYLGGMLVGLLPGLGASQATFLVQEGMRARDTKKFLVAIGGVMMADAVFSLLALWLIGNPRSGVAVSVGEMLDDLTAGDVVALLGVMCVSASLAAVTTLKFASSLAGRLGRVDYEKMTMAVIIGLIISVLLLTGVEGLLLLALSTSIGLVAISSGARRAYCMGCLLVPTILFFAGV